MRRRRPVVLPIAVLLVIFAASCGDDGDSTGEAGGMPTIEELQAETWSLDGAASSPAIDSGAATLQFEDRTVHGASPCNTYTGAFELDDDSISIGPIASTMRACADDLMAAEQQYLSALESVDTVELADTTLTLSGDDVTLVFEAFDLDSALVGEWTIVSVASGDAIVSTIVDSDTTLTLEEGGAASVTTGCNSGSTTWERDGSELSFGQIAGTLMACEDDLMQQQDAIFAALESTVSFELSPGQLTLLDDQGHIMLVAIAEDA